MARIFLFGRTSGFLGISRVSDLIDLSNRSWKQYLVQSFFDTDTTQKIEYEKNWQDKLVRTRTKNGSFTVKSAYQTLYNMKYHHDENFQYQSNNHWQRIWKLQIIPRKKLFIWKCFKDILPTKERICKLETCIVIDASESESQKHILLDCTIARVVWFKNIGIRASEVNNVSEELVDTVD